MDLKNIIESLSPNELKILPYLEDKNVVSICKKSNLDKTSVIRALEFLKNKGIIDLSYDKKSIIDLGVNGILYKRKGLPERRLLNTLGEKRILSLQDAAKQSKISDEELKASIGSLKKRNLIDIKNKKIILNMGDDLSKKTPEEIFIDNLPLDSSVLNQEQNQILKELQKRKNIVKVREEKEVVISITPKGKEIIHSKINSEDLIEQVTPEMIKSEKLWKGKRFRRYDVTSPVPVISGGKRHFVNQATDYGRRIWTDMGFREMTGSMLVSSFWNFDALFTAQDHPVREMQDTFFVNKKASAVKDKELVKRVKESHEKGTEGSKGWNYEWDEEESRKMVLRTHTTSLSSQTLAKIDKDKLPQKFYALGKCFRNETVDWSHGFEFNQSEGIVVDRNANFRHLLGYLKAFFSKMGFDKIRFRPGYFPYTEPSVEIDAWNEDKKVWLELGGAGIFRPEVTIPLLGEQIPVLAWGPGFDRILMDYYQIKDLRELYKNDLNTLRRMKFWMKN